MTLDTSSANKDDLPSISVNADVYRELIQQFYESSIERYGPESEQSRMLKMHLTAHPDPD
jgi:hypothetical protein